MAITEGRLARLALSTDGGSNYFDWECLVDATLNLESEELDATCHSSLGFRAFLFGRSMATIDGNTRYDEVDPGFVIARDAAISKTIIKARWRMSEVSGRDEYEADALITSVGLAGPNDDLADTAFTIRLSGDFTPSPQP